MNIGVNLLLIPKSGIAGGVEQYFTNTLNYLRRYDHSNTYFVFIQPSMKDTFRFEGARMHTVVVDEQTVVHRGFRWIEYHLGHRLKLTMPVDVAVDAHKIDLMFFPCTIMFPTTSRNLKKVLTVVDIQQEYFPEFFTRREMRQRRRHYRHSAFAADKVISISEYTSRTLREKYGVPGGNIATIGIAAGSAFFAPPDRETLERIKLVYDLPEHFFYYPASTWLHKNHLRLIEALAAYRSRYGEAPHLVLTGIKKNAHGRIEEAVRALNLRGEVHYLGYVPDADVVSLYQLATVLVYPSLFEGFGIPLVEAMVVGTPIICSSVTCLPDVAGDAALYFDPNNTEDIVTNMHTVWTSESVRQKLRIAGKRQAELFNPERIAMQTVELFSSIV